MSELRTQREPNKINGHKTKKIRLKRQKYAEHKDGKRERKELGKEHNTNCEFMTFGFKPRTCPGRELARLEIRFILATILRHMTPKLDPEFTHPYPVEQIFNLHLDGKIKQDQLKMQFVTQKEQKEELTAVSQLRM